MNLLNALWLFPDLIAKSQGQAACLFVLGGSVQEPSDLPKSQADTLKALHCLTSFST